MNNFKMTNMPKVYFGQGALKEALNTELKTVGDNVLLAYGADLLRKLEFMMKLSLYLKKLVKIFLNLMVLCLIQLMLKS